MLNQEDIIRMAREAGLIGGPVYAQGIERFAALVAAHEREECAKWAELVTNNMATYIASGIRVRGEK